MWLIAHFAELIRFQFVRSCFVGQPLSLSRGHGNSAGVLKRKVVVWKRLPNCSEIDCRQRKHTTKTHRHQMKLTFIMTRLLQSSFGSSYRSFLVRHQPYQHHLHPPPAPLYPAASRSALCYTTVRSSCNGLFFIIYIFSCLIMSCHLFFISF